MEVKQKLLDYLTDNLDLLLLQKKNLLEQFTRVAKANPPIFYYDIKKQHEHFLLYSLSNILIQGVPEANLEEALVFMEDNMSKLKEVDPEERDAASVERHRLETPYEIENRVVQHIDSLGVGHYLDHKAKLDAAQKVVEFIVKMKGKYGLDITPEEAFGILYE